MAPCESRVWLLWDGNLTDRSYFSAMLQQLYNSCQPRWHAHHCSNNFIQWMVHRLSRVPCLWRPGLESCSHTPVWRCAEPAAVNGRQRAARQSRAVDGRQAWRGSGVPTAQPAALQTAPPPAQLVLSAAIHLQLSPARGMCVSSAPASLKVSVTSLALSSTLSRPGARHCCKHPSGRQSQQIQMQLVRVGSVRT